MRALTPVEVQNLEFGTLPADVVGPPANDDEQNVIRAMLKRGLLGELYETDAEIGFRTTAGGALALRVHCAYLASMGAAS